MTSRTKFFTILSALLLLISASAMADTCNNFATYVCANSGLPNTVHIIGNGPTNSSVGTTMGLITGTSFGVTMEGNGSAADIIIIAAFPGPVSGSLNSINFTSISSFPEGGALGAIGDTWKALNITGGPATFGYVDLHSALGAGQTLTVNVSGTPTGTVVYALALNQVQVCTGHGKDKTCSSQWQITNLTPNSEGGITGTTPGMPTPEPGTLGLLGTGLLGLAGAVRRRFVS